MYTKEKFIQLLKIKNILLTIFGVFLLISSTTIFIQLVVYYRENIQTALHAKSMPGVKLTVIIGILSLINAGISKHNIQEANFYSSYFEGSLDGYVLYNDLAEVTGKSKKKIRRQLRTYLKIYMKNYEIQTINYIEQIVLKSKLTECECRQCGGIIEKRAYFTGKCPYCGSSDLFAKILANQKFYRIENTVKDGIKHPEFYVVKNIKTKLAIFAGLLCAGISIVIISLIGCIDTITKYNNKEHLVEVLLSGKSYSSFTLIKAEILKLFISFLILFVAFVILSYFRIRKIGYITTADRMSHQFATCTTPFVEKDRLLVASNHTSPTKILKPVRSAIRRRYLINCTLESHDGQLLVALAKKIIKDQCPTCGAPITGAVDEHYVCQYCRHKIMNVIVKT